MELPFYAVTSPDKSDILTHYRLELDFGNQLANYLRDMERAWPSSFINYFPSAFNQIGITIDQASQQLVLGRGSDDVYSIHLFQLHGVTTGQYEMEIPIQRYLAKPSASDDDIRCFNRYNSQPMERTMETDVILPRSNSVKWQYMGSLPTHDCFGAIFTVAKLYE